MKQCEQCYFLNETAYTLKIDGIKVQTLCRKCAGQKASDLKERFGWYPEIHRNDYTHQQMTRHDIKKLCENNLLNILHFK
jgi:hypothetical protein